RDDRQSYSYQQFLGPIKGRKKGAVRGWIGEGHICDIGSSLTLAGCNLIIPGAKTTKVFQRFYYDGQGVGYFSFGFRVPRRFYQELNSLQDVENNSEPALQTAFSSENLRLQSKHSPLDYQFIQGGGLLRSLYLRGTTKPGFEDQGSHLVGVGRPIFCVDIRARDLDSFYSPNRIAKSQHNFLGIYPRSMNAFHEGAFSLRSSAFSDFSTSFIVCARRKTDFHHARFLRLGLQRLFGELYFFDSVLSFLAGPHLVETDDEGRSWLALRINACVKRLGGSDLPTFAKGKSPYKMLASDFSLIDIKNTLSDLENGLKAIGARPGLSRRVLDLVVSFEASQKPQVSLELFMGDKVSGDKNVVNAKNVGGVGSGQFATENVGDTYVPKFDNTQLKSLAKELQNLEDELKGRSSSADELAAVAAVAKAKEQAEKQSEESMLDALKSAGKWALDVAKEVGVPLAISAISIALGLGAV
ncbi:MAG: hypothetical protein AAFN04_09525, partial [Pseudomonadota bacterium]